MLLLGLLVGGLAGVQAAGQDPKPPLWPNTFTQLFLTGIKPANHG
jgi:hypothetical protein